VFGVWWCVWVCVLCVCVCVCVCACVCVYECGENVISLQLAASLCQQHAFVSSTLKL